MSPNAKRALTLTVLMSMASIVCASAQDSDRDAALKKLKEGMPYGGLSAPSAWRMTFSSSPVDDSQEVFAENFPSVSANSDSSGAIKELLAFCKDHKTGLVLNTNGFWGIPVYGTRFSVTYRMNNGAAVKQGWPAATSADGAFYPGNPTSFLSSWADGDRMFFRIVDATGREHEATFDTTGTRSAAKMIELGCKSKSGHKS